MLLYGHHNSGHAYKVRLFLLMAQIPHEYRWIDIAQPHQERPADFIAASTYGEVPILVDEGRNWCQSNAILLHLAQKTGHFAGHPSEWPRVVEWLFWEPNRINYSIPNLRYFQLYEPHPAPVQDFLTRRAQADLATLNAHLSKQSFLLDSGFTIADISCASYLFWIEQAKLDLQPYPHVQRWLNNISQLPHWQSADQALQAP